MEFLFDDTLRAGTADRSTLRTTATEDGQVGPYLPARPAPPRRFRRAAETNSTAGKDGDRHTISDIDSRQASPLTIASIEEPKKERRGGFTRRMDYPKRFTLAQCSVKPARPDRRNLDWRRNWNPSR